MARKHDDPKMLCVFEAIGSFFVHELYNPVYQMSQAQVTRGKKASVTDAYYANVVSYMQCIQTMPQVYTTTVKKLHEYYRSNSGFSEVLFSDFQDKMLRHFIPPEYYRDFTEKHKDKVMHDIVVKTVANFAQFVLSKNMFRAIIDNHNDRSNVTMLQERIVDIYRDCRDEYYAKFVQQVAKPTTGSVSKRQFDMLKKAFADEKRRSCGLESERDRAMHMVRALMTRLQHATQAVEDARKQAPVASAQTAPAQTMPAQTAPVVWNVPNEPMPAQTAPVVWNVPNEPMQPAPVEPPPAQITSVSHAHAWPADETDDDEDDFQHAPLPTWTMNAAPPHVPADNNTPDTEHNPWLDE